MAIITVVDCRYINKSANSIEFFSVTSQRVGVTCEYV